MEQRKRIIPIVLLLVILAAGYYLYSTGQLPFLGFAAGAESNVVSGYIEGQEVNVAPEIGGRIEAVTVDEGARVTAGQELVRIDRTLMEAQIAQAQAAVDTANAQLAQVQAGPRPEDVRQAEAAVAQSVAAQDGAKQAWENAKSVRDNPQELDARIAAAETQYKTAKFQLDAALANAQAAATLKDQVGVDNQNPKAKVIVQQWAAAQAAVDTAQAALNGAQQNLEVLNGMRTNPLTANAQVDAAQAQYETAAAAAQAAQARLDAVKAGATREQIAVAAAQVKQAEAALAVLKAQENKLTINSPVDGIVTRRAFHAGEMATPGAAILTISDLDPVDLTVYVPETDIGRIKLGREVSVQVDSFPGRVFKGHVVFVNSQAEFTPRNVQTKTERVNTVFAVKVELQNASLELKPGMPADAYFDQANF